MRSAPRWSSNRPAACEPIGRHGRRRPKFCLQPGQWTDEHVDGPDLPGHEPGQAWWVRSPQTRCSVLRALVARGLSILQSNFDIGSTVSCWRYHPPRRPVRLAPLTPQHAPGTAMLMRLAPVPMYFSGDAAEAIAMAAAFQNDAPGPGSSRRLPLLRWAVPRRPCGASTRRRSYRRGSCPVEGLWDRDPWRRRSPRRR